MFVFRFSFFLVVFLLLGVIAYLIWYFRTLGRARKELNAVFTRVEDTYLDFVKKRLTLAMIEEQDLEASFDTIKQEAMQVMKPQLDTIWTMLEQANYEDVRLQSDRQIFVSAKILIEKFCRTPFDTLTADQKEQNLKQLRLAFQDGITADLAQRRLSFKVGDRFVP